MKKRRKEEKGVGASQAEGAEKGKQKWGAPTIGPIQVYITAERYPICKSPKGVGGVQTLCGKKKGGTGSGKKRNTVVGNRV